MTALGDTIYFPCQAPAVYLIQAILIRELGLGQCGIMPCISFHLFNDCWAGLRQHLQKIVDSDSFPSYIFFSGPPNCIQQSLTDAHYISKQRVNKTFSLYNVLYMDLFAFPKSRKSTKSPELSVGYTTVELRIIPLQHTVYKCFIL